MTVVTRFAPSPTGELHIGGARTALFNYLFAKKNNGKFLLRIEDTDSLRSSEKYLKSIIEGLEWLNIQTKDTIIYQSNNFKGHSKIAEKLLATGYAYKCYLNQSELIEYKKQKNLAFRSPWRDKEFNNTQNLPYVIRIKMPIDGEIEFNDLVQGKIVIKYENIDDFVILRSDKTPTYMLAVVSDDYDMGITHVIRGDDHINNTFKQLQIYKSLKWNIPEFAHIPLIHGNDGSKLSKRHGALSILDYKKMGFIPEGLINYLSRLGWSHNDDELFSLREAITWFNLDSIGKSSSKFDEKKLLFTNSFWLRNKSSVELYNLLSKNFNNHFGKLTKKWLLKLLPQLVLRANTLNELNEVSKWLYNEKCPKISKDDLNIFNDKTKTNLSLFSEFLLTFKNNDFFEESFNDLFNEWLKNKNLQMKDIGMPIRIALTGIKNSPSINDVIITLGIEECVKRISKICNE